MGAREELAAVLGEHRIATWSDHTYSCRTCANRYEQTAEPFEMREYAKLSKPDWNYEQAMDHLANALLASPALARPLDEARGEALRGAAEAVRSAVSYGFELRPDGSEDPTAAVYVEGLRDAWQIVSDRADAIATTEGAP